MTSILPQASASDALATLNRLQDLLPTSLFADSKDWSESDIVGRVEWLLAMYEGVKAERDEYVNQLNEICGV